MKDRSQLGKRQTRMGDLQDVFGFLFEVGQPVNRRAPVISLDVHKRSAGYVAWLAWSAPLSGTGLTVRELGHCTMFTVN